MKYKVILAVAGIGVVSMFIAANVQTKEIPPSQDIAGYWRVNTPDSMIIAIAPCGEKMCGRIVHLGRSKSTIDAKNPQLSLQNRELCGLNVFPEGLVWHGEVWRGVMYFPQNGTDYEIRATKTKDGALHLAGNTPNKMMSRSFGYQQKWLNVGFPSETCKPSAPPVS